MKKKYVMLGSIILAFLIFSASAESIDGAWVGIPDRSGSATLHRSYPLMHFSREQMQEAQRITREISEEQNTVRTLHPVMFLSEEEILKEISLSQQTLEPYPVGGGFSQLVSSVL